MAAAAGYEWSHPQGSPPEATSPESPDLTAEYSTVYPGRPIRPLPRRRIRARLSLEQAEAIVFPHAPSISSPLLGSPSSPGERGLGQPYYPGDIDATSQDDHDHDHIHEHTCGCDGEHSELDSEEEEEEEKTALAHRYSWPGRMMRLPREYLERVTNRSKPPAPNSTTSSADGYESFENTNNKKKRKIPLSGAGLSGSHDLVSNGVKSVDAKIPIDQRSYADSYCQIAPGASGLGLAGAGRGRHVRLAGRLVNDRRPLAASTNALNANVPGATGTQSIKSSAIADEAGKGPVPIPKGQENVSLLQRQREGTPQAKDFTFQFESPSTLKMGMASHPPPPPAGSRVNQVGQRPLATHGAQANAGPTASPAMNPQGAADVPPVERERTEAEIKADENREYRRAARERKREQQYRNRASKQKPQDEWICEFCEYELIFGRPPRALIRSYEEKDWAFRKGEAERKRLLDKAKAKGRKLKKGARAARSAQAAGGSHAAQSQYYDDQYDPSVHPQDRDSQGDEFFEDGVDESLPPTPYPEVGGPSMDYQSLPTAIDQDPIPPDISIDWDRLRHAI